MKLQMHENEEVIRVHLLPHEVPIPPGTECTYCAELATERDEDGKPICCKECNP